MPLQLQIPIPPVALLSESHSLGLESMAVESVDMRTGFRATAIENRTILERSFQARHDYFVRRRRWVPEDVRFPGLETDRYDGHAVHVAATCEGGVRAYLRALPFDPSVGFMLDDELSAILSESERQNLQREGALELSRLVCGPCSCTGCSDACHPVEFVLRLLYQLAKARGYHIFYAVVERSWLKPFERRFGLPFRPIGEPYTFPDGTETVAAVATLRELEGGMRRHSPLKFKWYTEGG